MKKIRDIDIKKIRKGNDIAVTWSIFDGDDNPYDLTGRDVRVTLFAAACGPAPISALAIDGNTVRFTFYGKDQQMLGRYAVVLEENRGEEGMKTVDKVDAFQLVAHTYQAGGEDTCSHLTTETVELSSKVEAGPKGDPGPYYTPSVDSEGNLSWINNGDLPNPETVNIKGPKGEDAEVTKENIEEALGFTPSDFSGDYNDLENKPDLSEFATTQELDSALARKQDALVSGQNIKTVNNESLLGPGNITIQGGGETDSSMSPTSENPVQNKVIYAQLQTKVGSETVDNIVELTKAQYDALATKDPGTLYIITDAGEADGYVSITRFEQTQSSSVSGGSNVWTVYLSNGQSFNLTVKNGKKGDDAEVTAENIEEALGYAPQEELESGVNIKTINNQSILGSGNIEIQGGGSADAVLYTPQSLTDAQKGQARSNIGAGTSSFSGSYNDLTNKPSIPTDLSDLSDDSTHRLVTDTEKSTWNGYGTSISGINDKIPAQASSQNQLADKNFVNSSVSTATATFRGTFTDLPTLQATNGDKNDYAFYNHTDSAGNAIYDRYKYVGPPVDRLPDGYTEMLYLRKGFNVTAYIDTGIKIQSTDKIYIKCYGWEYEASEYVAFGASDSNGKYFRFNKQYLGGAAFVETSMGSINAANLYNGSAIIECYDGKVYSSDIDGENKTLKGNLTLETVDNNFFLFAYNDGINNTISRYPQSVSLGDFIVYDQNGNKKLELIPCSNNLDAIGYYDTVSETFIAPTGDGLTAQALPTDKWLYEYSLNNSSFTSAQWASINSGITSSAVTKLSNLPTKPVDTAVQSLSAAEQLQARTNIGATAPEIFWATYGTTTAAEIDAAVAEGKAVICRHHNRDYVLSFYDPTNSYIYFGHVYAGNLGYVYVTRSTGIWNSGLRTPEQIANKVSSWRSTPDDTKYPSEKLVKDSLDEKYEKPSTGIPASDIASGVIPDVSGKENTSNKVTSLSSSSTDTEYPSAKATYDAINPAVQSAQPSGGFAPNVLYNLGELTGTVTFALATPADANIANHYYWTFETDSTAPTITWPTGITWIGGSAPTINASKHYEISVLNGIGVAMEV